MLLNASSPKKIIPNHWMALLGCFAGICCYLLPVLGFNATYFPGDLGDARLNLYFLEHNYQYFFGELKSYWDVQIMYPELNVMAYSDNLLGSSPGYFIFRFLDWSPIRAFQGWFVLVTLLNYCCSLLFFQSTFKRTDAAVIAASVFSFSGALVSQLTHAQTFPRFAIPLAFWAAYRFHLNRHPGYFMASLLFLIWQFYCGIYLGFMLSVALALFYLTSFITHFFTGILKNKGVLWWLQIVASIGINLLLLWYLMQHYVHRSWLPNDSHYQSLLVRLPNWRSYFLSSHASLLWKFLCHVSSSFKDSWDHQLFPGLITISSLLGVVMLMLYELFIRRRKELFEPKALLVLTGIFLFILFFKVQGFSAYYSLYYIPGFSSMYALTRIINVELLFWGLAVGMVYLKLATRFTANTNWLFVIGIVLLGLDNFHFPSYIHRTEVSTSEYRLQRLNTAFSSIPRGAVVSYEPKDVQEPVSYIQLDAMLLAQAYGLKSLNGYSGNCPFQYSEFWQKPGEDARINWLNNWRNPIDSLYVIQFPNQVIKTNYRYNIHREIDLVKKRIKRDEKWLSHIMEKAEKKGISLDSMLTLDAIWMVDEEEKNRIKPNSELWK